MLMPDEVDELALLQQLRAGDRDALAELMTRYRDRLRGIVRAQLDFRLGTRLSESDVLQEIYLSAEQRVTHFADSRPPLPFLLWLKLLAHQCLSDLYRRHVRAAMRDVRREVPLEARPRTSTSTILAHQLVGPSGTPSEAVSLLEKLSSLESALDSMNAVDREVVALRHFAELTNRETALALGIEPSAASKRYVRAMRRLRSLLNETETQQ